jgi:two-component system, chemotaxis family, chemotaxis protein CheY
MVVDDSRFMRLRLAHMLEAQGHEVVLVDDGNGAAAAYAMHHPDAVLMDVVMPGLDGLAALRAIRRLDPSARVLMVSTMAQQHIVDQALDSGAVDFVTKPVSRERLVGALNRALAGPAS